MKTWWGICWAGALWVAACGTSGTSSPAGSDDEPVFDPSTQTLIEQDEFDGYSSFDDTVAGGWHCSDGSTTQDTSTNPDGACQVIGGGYDGQGKAIRLVYDGIANAAGQEAHAWDRAIVDPLAAMPGHALYVSHYFRVNPGGGFALDDAAGHIVKVKWLELWNTQDRAQFSTSWQQCYDDVPQGPPVNGGTIWNFFASAGNNTTCQAGQVRPQFMYQGAGQWHRLTYKYVTRSSSAATDGVGQLWYDGTLIMSVKASDCGVTVPGSVGDAVAGETALPTSAENHFPAQWCQTKDLTGFFVATPVDKLTLGSVSTSTLWPFSIDYDHFMIWRD